MFDCFTSFIIFAHSFKMAQLSGHILVSPSLVASPATGTIIIATTTIP